MSDRSHLVPKTVVNALGHTTTVYVRPEDAATLRSTPLTVTSAVPANPEGASLLSQGERIGEPVELTHGVVETRRLHEGREPVHVLTTEEGETVVLGRVSDLTDSDFEDEEMKAWYDQPGLITQLDASPEEYDGGGASLNEFIRFRGTIGIDTNLVPGHRNGWPMTTDDFARVAVVDQNTRDWDWDYTSAEPRDLMEDEESWMPARLVADFVNTEAGRAWVESVVPDRTEVPTPDGRYPEPPLYAPRDEGRMRTGA